MGQLVLNIFGPNFFGKYFLGKYFFLLQICGEMYRYKVNSDLAANQSKGPSSSFFGYFTFYILLRICLKAKPSHAGREVGG